MMTKANPMITIHPDDRVSIKSVQWLINQGRHSTLALLGEPNIPVAVGEDGTTYTSKTGLREALRKAAGDEK